MHYQCEYQKSSRFRKTTSLHMQYTNYLMSLSSLQEYDMKISTSRFTFYGGCEQPRTEFSFLFLNLDMVLTHSTPGELPTFLF